jgi:hypothetical protein
MENQSFNNCCPSTKLNEHAVMYKVISKRILPWNHLSVFTFKYFLLVNFSLKKLQQRELQGSLRAAPCDSREHCDVRRDLCVALAARHMCIRTLQRSRWWDLRWIIRSLSTRGYQAARAPREPAGQGLATGSMSCV